ncbi:MAG: efflux RND transporter periplasmic adaptor subunit [Leptospiraceae bacterium]|nr:efflux RND transporter periplasmic adaptor subunit [Leptospiraceae bacterium]
MKSSRRQQRTDTQMQSDPIADARKSPAPKYTNPGSEAGPAKGAKVETRRNQISAWTLRLRSAFARRTSQQKRSVIFGVALGVLLAVALAAPQCKKSDKERLQEQGISHYTCPMHPQIHEYKPGHCPICHMQLVPVRIEGSDSDKKPATNDSGANPSGESVSADEDSANKSKESPDTKNTFLVSPERQQLIGVTYSDVRKSQANFHIETTGRGAFDPELGVAVKEYLMVYRDPSLREAAISRLKLLGMGSREIGNITRYRAAYESLYNPSDGGPVWVYATLYESDAVAVKPGMKARVHIPGTRSEGFTGQVISLSPVVASTTRTIDARILVPNAGGQIRPDSFVHVDISVPLGEALIVPRSAIVDNGESRYVFVQRGQGKLEVRHVEIGPELDEGVVILEGLNEGERVVDNGTFLIDSESQLKSSFRQFDRDSKPSSGHQHGSDETKSQNETIDSQNKSRPGENLRGER